MSLIAQSLSVARGRNTVVHGVDLIVQPGEQIAIVGPNGSGKSTLLHALSGELRPVSGTVSLDGTPLHDWHPRALARQRALLSQAGNLSFPFTLEEVVGMGRAPHGGPRDNDPAVAHALDLAGVTHLADRPWTRLSGGERQRGRLARVLAQLEGPAADGTRILLLDEPTNHLDLAWMQATLMAATEAAKNGLAVIAVLHDLNQALGWADRVLLLDKGRVAALDRAESALDPARIGSVYGVQVDLIHNPADGRAFLVPAAIHSIPQGATP